MVVADFKSIAAFNSTLARWQNPALKTFHAPHDRARKTEGDEKTLFSLLNLQVPF